LSLAASALLHVRNRQPPWRERAVRRDDRRARHLRLDDDPEAQQGLDVGGTGVKTNTDWGRITTSLVIAAGHRLAHRCALTPMIVRSSLRKSPHQVEFAIDDGSRSRASPLRQDFAYRA